MGPCPAKQDRLTSPPFAATPLPPLGPGLGLLGVAPALAALGVLLVVVARRRSSSPLATMGALLGAVAAAFTVFLGLWWGSRAFAVAERGGWPCSLALAVAERASAAAALSTTAGSVLGVVAAFAGFAIGMRGVDAVRFRALLTASLISLAALLIAVERGAPAVAVATVLGRAPAAGADRLSTAELLCHAPVARAASARGLSTRGCEHLDDTLRTTGAPGHDAEVAALASRCADLTLIELTNTPPAERAALLETRLGSAWAAEPALRHRLLAAGQRPAEAPDAGAP